MFLVGNAFAIFFLKIVKPKAGGNTPQQQYIFITSTHLCILLYYTHSWSDSTKLVSCLIWLENIHISSIVKNQCGLLNIDQKQPLRTG